VGRCEELQEFARANERSAWIILNDPAKYAGLPTDWAQLWEKRHGTAKEPKDHHEYGLEDRLAEQYERRERRKIQARRRRWKLREWRISRKGNPYAKIRGGFHIVLFPQGSGWSISAADKEDDYQSFAKKRYQTIEEAKDGAFDALIFLQSRRKSAHPGLVFRYDNLGHDG
jgi:hypothetical protein